MQITSASISNKELGKFKIEQEFTYDATEDFKSQVSSLLKELETAEDKKSVEDEIMSQFGDYDYVDVDRDELYDQLSTALNKYPFDIYINETMVYVNSSIGYPTDSTTMDQVWESVKKIKITVEVSLSYELHDHTFSDIETDLAKLVIAGAPDRVKKV